MEVRVLHSDKNSLELELGGVDPSLAQVLAEKLSADKDVAFAASMVEHPLIGVPKVIVKTKKGDPTKLVLEKLDEIRKDVSDFRSKFKSVVK